VEGGGTSCGAAQSLPKGCGYLRRSDSIAPEGVGVPLAQRLNRSRRGVGVPLAQRLNRSRRGGGTSGVATQSLWGGVCAWRRGCDGGFLAVEGASRRARWRSWSSLSARKAVKAWAMTWRSFRCSSCWAARTCGKRSADAQHSARGWVGSRCVKWTPPASFTCSTQATSPRGPTSPATSNAAPTHRAQRRRWAAARARARRRGGAVAGARHGHARITKSARAGAGAV
jgi:hypothetical protein